MLLASYKLFPIPVDWTTVGICDLFMTSCLPTLRFIV